MLGINLDDYKWVPWILIILGWFVGRHVSLNSSKKSEANNKIRDFNTLVKELEAESINFWLQKESIVLQMQLTAKLGRISKLATDISNVDIVKKDFPSGDITKLRQAITNYKTTELTGRPISSFDNRLFDIVNYSNALQKHFSTIV